MFDPITIGAAIIPLAAKLVGQAGSAIIQKYLAPEQVKPVSIQEYIDLKNADINLLNAIAALDKGGETYKWVEAIRQLQRPFVVVVTLAIWAYCHASVKPGVDLGAIDNVAGAVGFYLFGDRTLFYFDNKAKGVVK